MSWKTVNRNNPVVGADAAPLLGDAVREKIRAFLPRYEESRAALLPALHVVQDALGHVPPRAMVEIAEILDIHPSDVIDTISFYTHFWTHEKGNKVITVCRSLSCELMGGKAMLQEISRQLGIGIHETTADGRYSLVTEECLAGCDYAPCMLINEKMHKFVKPEEVAGILADDANDMVEMPRSDLFDAPREEDSTSNDQPEDQPKAGGDLETTSDVDEMKEAD
ncbi:MAG: NADH-quinone oxidoreductase subunit NuoE family protein [Planctomycetota bacterium]|jgi:NADH-quinone oxidoreductase subunit E